MTTLGFGQSTGQIVQRAYVDRRGDGAPGFVEPIPATPGMDEMFTRYWRASAGRDGSEPVRFFA